MDDKRIIELFWERSEQAIAETDKKYGKYILHIARNILENDEDACEVQNDTYMRVWDTIPPNRPDILRAYVGTISRNLSLDRYRQKYSQKRGVVSVAIDELGECISDTSASDETESARICDALNRFVAQLPARTRKIFVLRYWYMFSIEQIACEHSMKNNTVTTILFRTRKELKKFLEKEEISV